VFIYSPYICIQAGSGNTAAASPLHTTKAAINKSNQGHQSQCEKATSFHFIIDISIGFSMENFTTSM
jgi:hypothetical protein